MLKDSDIAGYSTRRTHRTYTLEFKAELVAACQQPGVSIAALANSHAMNAIVLHRWIKEHEHSGHHQLLGSDPNWFDCLNFTDRSVHPFETAPLQRDRAAQLG